MVSNIEGSCSNPNILGEYGQDYLANLLNTYLDKCFNTNFTLKGVSVHQQRHNDVPKGRIRGRRTNVFAINHNDESERSSPFLVGLH